MSDIFISYAREDKGRVEILAKALQAKGWSVWWDPHIPTGKRFDQVIEAALTEARCIIVVWSSHSVSSLYVVAEAKEGAEREILVPVMIEDVKVPLVFRQFQTARLMDWHGSTQDPAFEKLVKDIEGTLGLPATPPKTTEDSSSEIHAPIVRRRVLLPKYPITIGAVVFTALLIGLVIWLYNSQGNRTSPPNDNLATPSPSPTSSPQTGPLIRNLSDLEKQITVTHFAFYQGECSDTSPPESALQPFVDHANLPQTRSFVRFEFPMAMRHIDFILVVRFYDLNGTARGEMTKQNAYVEPNWINSWHCTDPGLDKNGTLAKGSYNAEIYIGEYSNKLSKVGARRIDVD